jgi:hypothetical protein
MNSNQKLAFRVGAFAAQNSGTIHASVARVNLGGIQNGSGFVFDNSGTVTSSLSLRAPKNTGRSAGFCQNNRGRIQQSAWIKPHTETEKNPPADKKPKLYKDEQLRHVEESTDADILQKYGLTEHWQGADGLMPDAKANTRALEGATVDIATGKDLLELIARINSGDMDAAAGCYRLTADINLHGKSIAPLGINDGCPFTGMLDGGCYKISNFKIKAKGTEYAGFFGYVKGGKISNLTLDYVLSGKGGNVCGGMVGYNDGGSFYNCHVRLLMDVSICSGGFAGKNTGELVCCSVNGRMKFPVPLLLYLAPVLAVLLIGALVAGIIALTRSQEPPYTPPDRIDINAAPVPDDNINVPPPPAGSNRISFEVQQEIFISYATKVGIMNYVNPRRSTQDVIVSLCVTDAELQEHGVDLVATGVRTAEEMAAANYNPAKALTTLYKSDLLPIGYKLEGVKISALPDGSTHLDVGKYDMLIVINAYDPVTHEKAVINAQAPVTVEIVDR